MQHIIDTTELELLLSKGADERIFLNENGLTKYGAPLFSNEVVNRGSCTCSSATEEDVVLIQEILGQCASLDDWLRLKEKVTCELKIALNVEDEDNFEIFYAPSGTDLFYLPLMFSRLLKNNLQILNIVTCIEELGSGTRFSSKGLYHADYNQFGKRIRKKDYVVKSSPVKTIFLSARSEDGKILDNKGEIDKLVEIHPDCMVIINLVCGSKSGIEDDLRLIDEIEGGNIMWVVDLCQFRHSRDILNMLLSKNVLVMITGSKFYESPPFSGAMLVPNPLYHQLLKADSWGEISEYGTLFSKYDFPSTIGSKLNFKEAFNKPLTLRWMCALEEIKKFNSLPIDKVEEKIDLWREVILHKLKSRAAFELIPHQELTNKTIISFRLKHHGTHLGKDEMEQLYFSIVTDYYGDDYPFSRIRIGQPVSYGEKVFLRLAIGSKTIRWFVENDEKEFSYDKAIISIIESKLHQFYENNT